jgi:O-antigen/teichoic acid export membrane protein
MLPEDFGLFGMALTVVTALNAFTTIGLDQSILSRKFEREDELNAHLNTVWSAELLRSVVLALLVAGSGYLASRFYGQPKLAVMLPLLSLTTLLQGVRNIGLLVFRKQIRFGKIFWYEQTANLLATVVVVGLVFIMRNVWALVFGQVISAALAVFLSYVFHSHRPHFSFDREATRSAIKFGKFGLIIAVTSYVTTMADNVTVGRIFGMEGLGNYVIAYNLASLPITVLVYTFSTVTLPAFAELSDLSARLMSAFRHVYTASLLLTVMITVPMFLLADEIVNVLFGNKWSAAAPALRILALIVPLRGAVLIISNLFFGIDRWAPVAIGKTAEAIVFLAIIYPLTVSLGLTGAAWAGVIVYAFGLINRFIALQRIAPEAANKLVRASFYIFAGGVGGFLAGWSALQLLDSMAARLLLGGFVSAMVPGVILIVIERDLRQWLSSQFFAGLRHQEVTP